MKKLVSLLLITIMILTCFVSVAFAADGWQQIDGEWQYLENGSPVKDKWIQTSGKWYYLNVDGIMLHDAFVKYADKYYYLTTDGSMLDKGWKLCVDDAGENYWIYANAGGALMQDGWLKDGKTWYWFDKDCVMATGLKKINDVWYAFKDNGTMADNEWFQETQYGFGLWFYANPGGALVRGWKQIKGKWYYFSDNVQIGYWDAPWMYNFGEAEIDGKYYCLDEQSGAMLTGWVDLLKHNYTYSILPELWVYYGEDGARRAGWVKDNGKWYYLANDGTYMYRNCIATIDTVYYAFGDSGAIPEGWFKTKVYLNGDEEKWVYSTVNGIRISSWVKDGNDWYYMDDNGYMVTGEYEIDGKIYTFDQNGKWIK